MDDLIHGIIDVSLGSGGRGRHRSEVDENDESVSQSREERTRSTWAQVVSGDEVDGEHASENSHDYTYNKTPISTEEQSSRYNEALQTGHRPKPLRHPQKQEEENNEGWETVGAKPPRHPKKVLTENWIRYKQNPSEQEYANDFECNYNIRPSEGELSDLSQACNKLWELDLNRLVPGKDYQIDCGEGKKVYQTDDMAAGSLFYWLSENIFRKPTFSRFCSLLDNYNPNQGYKEVVTAEEKQEQSAFIEEISRTAPIKYLHKYLSYKGVVSENYHEFKIMMTGLWFNLYSRGGASDSSAFEHVFVGEIKQRGKQEVSGFHNWLQFYMEEANGRVNYQGYIFPRRHGQIPDSDTQLLTIQFEWNGIVKSVSSSLVGVSPEFEVALYTLCYFVGEEDNHIQLGPYPVNIKCYRFGKNIGSVFPMAEN